MIASIQQDNKPTESRNMAVGFWSLIFFTVISLDVVSKVLVHEFSWPIFYNNNFAFSLPLPVPLMFILYFAILATASLYLFKSFSKIDSWQRLSWIMILAAGLSNVAERILRGSVTDFIFILNGVFNIADFVIILGVLILLSRKKTVI